MALHASRFGSTPVVIHPCVAHLSASDLRAFALDPHRLSCARQSVCLLRLPPRKRLATDQRSIANRYYIAQLSPRCSSAFFVASPHLSLRSRFASLLEALCRPSRESAGFAFDMLLAESLSFAYTMLAALRSWLRVFDSSLIHSILVYSALLTGSCLRRVHLVAVG